MAADQPRAGEDVLTTDRPLTEQEAIRLKKLWRSGPCRRRVLRALWWLEAKWRVRWNGACPNGGAHDWRTVHDESFGQWLQCQKCAGDGYTDYGR